MQCTYNTMLTREHFNHLTCERRAESIVIASSTQGATPMELLCTVKELVCSCCKQSWRPICPFCQLSTFLSRGCLLWAVGQGLKACCPGISGGRRVKGYSCVSCFLLQLLTRASIHQQALLHCPNPPLLPQLPMNK